MNLAQKSTGTKPTGSRPSPVDTFNRSRAATLPSFVRTFLETRFGADFSHVRIHESGDAAQSAVALGTRAYTIAQDVVFAPGRYAPHRPQGLHLLAHEALHTLQAPADSRATGAAPIAVSQAHDRHERNVDDIMRRPDTSPKLERLDRPTILRAPPEDQPLDLGVGLAQNADYFLAGALGSETIDGFVFGQADITPEQRPKLETLARRIPYLLDRFPESKIHIVGHTDAVDTEAKNAELGQRRADATLQALGGLGVPSACMDATSMGKTQLLVATNEPNSQNRRAEIRFVPAGRQHPVIPMTPSTPLGPVPPIDVNVPTLPPSLPGLGAPRQPDIFGRLPPAPGQKGPGGLGDIAKKVPWEVRPIPPFLWDVIKSQGKQGTLKWTIPPDLLPWWLK